MTRAPARGGLTTLTADLLLLTCALIWGTTFVAQKLATQHMGPVLFNGLRHLIGAAVVLPLAIRGWRLCNDPAARRTALTGGLLAGLAMFAGSTTQQVGMQTASISSAGFITGLYVIIVPLLGLAVGQRVRWPVWTGAVLAVVGLFFLSLYDPTGNGLHLQTGDMWVLACAFAWAFHVQILGWAAPSADPFVISVVQFAVTGIGGMAVSLVLSLGFSAETWGAREAFHWDSLTATLGPLAFASVLSTGLAFTLQVVAQRKAPPAHTAILLSLESVFSALAEAACLSFGVLGLASMGSPMTAWKLLGCALMFCGVLVSQVRLAWFRTGSTP